MTWGTGGTQHFIGPNIALRYASKHSGWIEDKSISYVHAQWGNMYQEQKQWD